MRFFSHGAYGRLLVVASLCSVLVWTVPLCSGAEPAAGQPQATDPNADTQTIQRAVEEQYQEMGEHQQGQGDQAQEPSVRPPDASAQPEESEEGHRRHEDTEEPQPVRGKGSVEPG